MSSNTIFISYSRKDTDFVSKFTKNLREAGANLWLDKQIKPGGLWDDSIESALETCQDVILILSKNSVKSNNVMDEISYALEENKRVIPIKIEECDVPFRLRRIQHIDYYLDEENSMKILLSALDLSTVKSSVVQNSISPKTGIQAEKEKVKTPEKATTIKKEVKNPTIEIKSKKKSSKFIYIIGLLILLVGVYYLSGINSNEVIEDDILPEEPIAVVTDVEDYAAIAESIEIADYENHLVNFPNCEHSNEVNLILKELRSIASEEKEYNEAIDENSSIGILNYLMEYKKDAIFYEQALTELDSYFTSSGFVQFSASNGELYFSIFEDEFGSTPRIKDLIFAKTQRFIHKGPYGSPGFGNKVHTTSKDEVFKVIDVKMSGSAYWIQVSF